MRELAIDVYSLLPVVATALAVGLILAAAHWLMLGRHPEFGRERRLPRQLAMLVLTVIGIVALALSLPVSESTQHQILGLIGIILSGVIAFSSATIFGNLMAGAMLRVTRPFFAGDFIRIDDHFGRVSERGLLDTEIQTEARELVSIPNSYMISRPITVLRSSGTIISTDVSIGYDVHHDEVESALKHAAEASGLTEPFVHVIALGDFSVSYRVNGLLQEVKEVLSARSTLARGVLDHLHAAGIEIVSPSFMNQRRLDPGARTLPRAEVVSADASDAAAKPEAVVFDKAEEAARAEQLHHDLASELERLESQLANAQGADRDAIEASIEQVRAQLEDHGSSDAP